jgi:LAO/AO transport system kinase
MLDCDRLLNGDRRALARAITLVENDDPQARAIIQQIYPHTGRAHIIGVTGAPGYGKSTLVNAIARVYRQRDLKVGVIAVDPTSPFTGGALLGDRVRMRDLAGDPGVFIRSMASRGYLGGLARATAEVVLILDAAGYQRILVETVGVGQAEVDIARTAHTTVVVQTPGMGDEVQAIKAGILEIADIFAINKADQDGVERTEAALQMLLATNAPAAATAEREPAWAPPIVRTIGTRGEGVVDLVDAIEAHARAQRASGRWQTRERARAAFTLQELLRDELMARLLARLPHDLLAAHLEQIASRQIDPYAAVAALLSAADPLVPDRPADDQPSEARAPLPQEEMP